MSNKLHREIFSKWARAPRAPWKHIASCWFFSYFLFEIITAHSLRWLKEQNEWCRRAAHCIENTVSKYWHRNIHMWLAWVPLLSNAFDKFCRNSFSIAIRAQATTQKTATTTTQTQTECSIYVWHDTTHYVRHLNNNEYLHMRARLAFATEFKYSRLKKWKNNVTTCSEQQANKQITITFS